MYSSALPSLTVTRATIATCDTGPPCSQPAGNVLDAFCPIGQKNDLMAAVARQPRAPGSRTPRIASSWLIAAHRPGRRPADELSAYGAAQGLRHAATLSWTQVTAVVSSHCESAAVTAGLPASTTPTSTRTHTTWYAVGSALAAAGYRVVCLDLRGYGESTVPPDRPDHSQASKRPMAADLVTLHTLGYSRFHAVGHDRGGYVVHRLALDHPGSVDRLVVLGDVPSVRRCATDRRLARVPRTGMSPVLCAHPPHRPLCARPAESRTRTGRGSALDHGA